MDKPLKEIEKIVGHEFIITDEKTLNKHCIDLKIPAAVISPGSEEEVSEILKFCYTQNISVVPVGSRTKISIGNVPVKLELVLCTNRLNKFIEHGTDDLIATAQAGITLKEFQKLIKKENQQLAVDPPNLKKGCTLGGIICTNDYGPSRLRYNAIRENLLALRFVRPDGKIVKGGAKVVKNVAGYDIPKLITGSLGTLGIITEATFRLYPIQPSSKTIIAYINNSDDINEINQKILNSDTLLTCFELCSKGLSSDNKTSFYALKIENVKTAVDSQTDQLENLLGQYKIENRQIISGREEKAFWERITNFYWTNRSKNNISLRIRVPISDVSEIVNIIEDIDQRTKSKLKLSASIGLGIINLNLENEVSILKNSYVLLSKKLITLGGNITILSAPTQFKEDLDIWGKVDNATLNLMRNIKHQFDPDNILNPGRFVGWI